MSRLLSAKIRSIFQHRDLHSLDSDGRAKERHKRAFLTGSISTLARFVQIGTSLITVPLTLSYLGNERFGLWMTISSILAIASFADFGIGNGVLNTVANAFGKNNTDDIRRAVSSGFFILTGIAGVLSAAFFSIYQFVDWGIFFRVTTAQAKAEAGPALAIFAVCFALNISMDVVQRVQLGIQQGYRYGLWQMCGSLLGFIGVLVGIRLRVGLPTLVMAIAGAPVLATALNTLHFFSKLRPDLRPSLRFISKKAISQIIRLGIFFFILQVVVAISFSADNLIITRAFGAASVPEYSIPQRMFSMLSILVGMLVAPLWPAYGEAISRGDVSWVRSMLLRSLMIVFVTVSGLAGLLLAFSHPILHIWVGNRVRPPFVLLLGFAIWTTMECCGNTLAAFLNGTGIIKFQATVAFCFGTACLFLKLIFIHHFGIQSIPWATISAYIVLNIVPFAVYIPKLLKRIGGNLIRQESQIELVEEK